MYVKVDPVSQLELIKILGLKAWSGRKQKYLTVSAGEQVIEYCFINSYEYKKFIRGLRKLEKMERED